MTALSKIQEFARRLLNPTAKALPESIPEEAVRQPPQDADAIVTHIEVNDRHGVGVLIRRLFGHDDNILSIRSQDHYKGRQDFGAMHVCVSHSDTSRDVVFRTILKSLRGATVKRVLCVPYFPDDARNAIAVKEIFGVPLCTFLMDDQNLCADGIPDSVMKELLARSALRLAISRELCAGYEQKYGHKMSLMPPLVPTRLIPPLLNKPAIGALQSHSGIIIGNIWGQRWIELLRETVRDSGITLRWYNHGEFRSLPCSRKALSIDGVIPQKGPPDPDERMVEILRQAPFVVVPSGTLDDTDDRRFIAQLSFPSRIPYIFATSHTPILVLGHPETAAARFVTGAGIGIVAPYGRRAFQDAVERITRPEVNMELRRAAFLLSIRFADLGASEWLWSSLAKGEPVDGRYEDLTPSRE